MANADKRLWRTADGGLVEDGDPRGMSLAYAPGDVIDEADVKALAKPANKAGRAPANKSKG